MEKVKYYQIAFKGVGVEQVYRKLISPTRAQVEALTADGYTVRGYKLASSVPNDPILAGTTVREKTADEKQALIDYKKSFVTSFNVRDILFACKAIDARNSDTVLADKLNAIMSNVEVMTHLSGAGGTVDLTDPITIQSMASFTLDEITAIKQEIL